jgi:hypothetical protein
MHLLCPSNGKKLQANPRSIKTPPPLLLQEQLHRNPAKLPQQENLLFYNFLRDSLLQQYTSSMPTQKKLQISFSRTADILPAMISPLLLLRCNDDSRLLISAHSLLQQRICDNLVQWRDG